MSSKKLINKKPFVFRFAEISDLPKVADLVNSAYRGESSKKGWTTEADLLGGQRTDASQLEKLISDKKNSIHVIEMSEDFDSKGEMLKKGEIIASVELQMNEGECYLGMLTVKPTLQNSRLGRWLLDTCEMMAKIRKSKKMHMTVITDRAELLAWYERRGYKRTGQLKDFHEDPTFGIPNKKLQMETLEKDLSKVTNDQFARP